MFLGIGQNFAFCNQPVLVFASGSASALQIKFIGALPDFIFETGPVEYGRRRFLSGFGIDGNDGILFRFVRFRGDNRRRSGLNRSGTRKSARGFSSGHTGILLTNTKVQQGTEWMNEPHTFDLLGSPTGLWRMYLL